MESGPKKSWLALIPLLIVVGVALTTRGVYLAECTDNGTQRAALEVQGSFPLSHGPKGTEFRGRTTPTQLDNLVASIENKRSLECYAPLSDKEETTAHVAPGFPWLHGMLVSYFASADALVRWLNCVLGGLTSGCCFLFARRAFHNTLIATLAGLLAAVHPFWIVNTGELTDGTLTSFLLMLALLSGTRGSQQGGAFTGLLFGLSLAALVLVRAALLPFATIALLMFLWQCRRLPTGWLVGLLAFVGFVNGIVPWALRNFNAFERPVPVVDSTYLHLWMGNNAHATGATLDEATLRSSLPPDRLAKLLDEPNQAARYNSLAPDVWREIQEHPSETISRRFRSGQAFLLGERWLRQRTMASHLEPTDGVATPPEWLPAHAEAILQGTLLGLFVLAFLGWRWSEPWRRSGRLATLAVLWVPVPYILSHAEQLAGPRLPLDGVLLCYAAYALVGFIPGLTPKPQPIHDDAPR